jgi:hypothetical protein
MVSDLRVIELLQPAVSEILSADAKAIAVLAQRKSDFAGLDSQPASTTMALERRARVATEMRTTIAPKLGWTLIEDNLPCGAYEWLAEDVVIRLSKTTRASRIEAFKACFGIQDTLFVTTASPAGPRDEVLIRLQGNALKGASIDAAAVRSDGHLSTTIPLKVIAAIQTSRITTVGEPEKTTVTLPGVRRSADSSG